MINGTVNDSICQPLWRYGLFAIDSEILVESSTTVFDGDLIVCDHPIPLDEFDRIIVVGAGKAGAGMAKGLLKVLRRGIMDKSIEGLVIVPDNCVEDLDGVALHGGRPAGLNEPTQRGVDGANKILELVKAAGPRDLVICLISGGGSALAPLPVESVTLEAKQEMTRFLSRSGANISELNCVRSAISQIKGGGLVRGFSGHSLHALIISDVLGNPLQTIASGMTFPQNIDNQMALEILEKYDPEHSQVDQSIYAAINTGLDLSNDKTIASSTNIFNHIVGDNQKCVESIANMARQLGFEAEFDSASQDEGDVAEVADRIWQVFLDRVEKGVLIRPFCFVSGGEPTVKPTGQIGKGGRNQHLALLILNKLQNANLPESLDFEFVSLGTDGEDGPTDAAGAQVNRKILNDFKNSELDLNKAIEDFDSYNFFQQLDGLILTGPTHTNVCDIRILVLKNKDEG